jgi:hypothetical protein
MLGSLIVAAALGYGGVYAWTHRPQALPVPVAEEQAPETETKTAVAPQAQPILRVVGPLADYLSHQATSLVGTPEPASHQLTAADHVEESPVGGKTPIVHRTFALARIVHFPFTIPPHAATPRFHGTFRSFLQQADGFNDESAANVELLLMNDAQYAELSAGREPDVLFISDASHYQDINFELSPSQNHPVKYHLLFRNPPGGAAKKVVQADFSVDF